MDFWKVKKKAMSKIREGEGDVWGKLRRLREMEEQEGNSDVDEVVFDERYDSECDDDRVDESEGDAEDSDSEKLQEDVFERFAKLREEEDSDVDEVVADWGLDSDDDGAVEEDASEGREGLEGGAHDDAADNFRAEEPGTATGDGDGDEAEGDAGAAENKKTKKKKKKKNKKKKTEREK